MKRKFLCRFACAALALSGLAGISGRAASFGLPVIDATNLTQNTVNTVSTLVQEGQQLDQYMKQLEQYKTQLDQFDDQKLNSRTLNQASWIWNNTQSMLLTTRNIYSQLNALGLNAYLGKLLDREDIRSNPCVSGSGACTSDDWTKLVNARQDLHQDRRQELTNWFNRQAELESRFAAADATLERLKTNSESAQGRLEAISYTNQLIAQLADQAAQLRDLQLETLRLQKARELAETADAQVREAYRPARDYGSVKPSFSAPLSIRFPAE